jgi:D-alanyl-D-alanine endopeptidase (penicillin-binding protein 7)
MNLNFLIRYFLLFLFSLNVYALPSIPVQENVTAKAFVVSDITGDVILEKNADDIRPVASITKLMTAIVVLDANQDLDEDITMVYKNHGYLHSKIPQSVKSLTRRQLINLAIVKSDNLAAQLLCENYPGGLNRCIAEMNHKAFTLHMMQTHYEDPTGLNVKNVSSANDLVKLVLHAKNYSELIEASGKAQVQLKVKKRWWSFGNTNPLVKKTNDIKISKTGYINASGGCVVMLIDTSVGERVIVLLGSKNTRTRFPEAQKILLTVSDYDIESTY